MGQWDIQWPVALEWNREGNEGRAKAGAAAAQWVHTRPFEGPSPPSWLDGSPDFVLYHA